MASASKYNSDLIALNTMYETAQITAFKIVLATAATADSQDGTTQVITEGTARNMLNALNPIMAQFAADGEELVVVMDGHANDITSIATRIGQQVDATGVIDGAGIWKDAVGGTAAVTVTAVTTFNGLLA